MRSLGYPGSIYGWLLLRMLLAATFFYAGVMKMMDPVALAASISRFEVLPSFLVHPLALTLPPLEVICALSLLLGRWKRQAAFGTAIMCAVFLTALIAAAVRQIDVECSCFGSASSASLWELIVRDFLLLLAAGAIYLQQAHAFPLFPGAATGGLNDADHCLQSPARMKSTQAE